VCRIFLQAEERVAWTAISPQPPCGQSPLRTSVV
jgi:hypothetical protein